MNKECKFANELIDFIYESPSAFHVVENVKAKLIKNDFKELDLREKWNIEKNGKYFVTKNDSAVISFIIGKGDIEKEGFRIIGAHTDSPTFKIKPSPEMTENGYLKLNTEVYGGPILNTWLDRPLSFAGRVTLKGEDLMHPESKLVDIKKPVLIIPNLAIHMNRDVNKGVELDKQKDMLPLMGLAGEDFIKEDFIVELMAKELKCNKEDIVDFDIYLYEVEKGSIIGINDEFISAGKLDDLAMVHAGIEAIIKAKESKSTKMMVCFDNEEIGSRTKQGAGSPMLKNIIERIVFKLGGDKEELQRALYSSFLISADMAHAVHPNSGEKHDPVNKPIINKGPVIKMNANQNYTTDSDSNTVYEMICRNLNIPIQKFVNRSTERGGSTIGPISSSQLDIRSIDIGNPMLAMHSVRELGGVIDHFNIFESFKGFFNL
ncbi:M18 family aminopeptidase [Clostridiaceae bacterium HSG29]|nr:M18 family aminopeptidase [Clostridiaceae bacterium HSG29]